MGARTRQAVRAVLWTPEEAVLLMRLEWAGEPSVWVTPGGGVEPGESKEQALRRELREETGAEPGDIGAELWLRTYTFEDGLEQRECFFFVPCERFEPRFDTAPDGAFREYRWWSADAIAGSSDLFAPRCLGRLLAEIRSGGIPARPIDVGL
jgi:8-oxo-dGTP pyrophosphatase MutT (NUDIX family)